MKKKCTLSNLIMGIAILVIVLFVAPKVMSTPLGHKTFTKIITTLATITTATITTATIDTLVVADSSVTGAFVLKNMSSTTLAAYTFAVGEVVYNTTRFAVCVGTAPEVGTAIFQSSNPITTAGISCKE